MRHGTESLTSATTPPVAAAIPERDTFHAQLQIDALTHHRRWQTAAAPATSIH
jgi:hypothetical protein